MLLLQISLLALKHYKSIFIKFSTKKHDIFLEILKIDS